MSRLRENNEGALADFLDGVLPALHPGSPDMEQPPDDNRKESRILLYESMLKRLDGEGLAGEEESHRLLMRLMVSPTGELARHKPRSHSALSEFVFGAPAGYTAMRNLERQAAAGAPLAKQPASDCRAGFEYTLDLLDHLGHKLAVRRVPTPKWSDFQHTESAHAELWRRYDDHFRSAYSYLKDERKAKAKAVKATANDTGYTEQNIRRVVGQKKAS